MNVSVVPHAERYGALVLSIVSQSNASLTSFWLQKYYKRLYKHAGACEATFFWESL